MNITLYKSLPDREKILLVLACLIDEAQARVVLSHDMRQGKTFSLLVESLKSFPGEIRRMVLLSLLTDAIAESILE